MNRHRIGIFVAVALLGSGLGVQRSLAWGSKKTAVKADVASLVVTAEKEVELARVAIEKGKKVVEMIPADSALMPTVAEMMELASENWELAIQSLQGAKESAARAETAKSDEVAGDFKLLARANADVAISGAQVVRIALLYCDGVAQEKSEALEIIQGALKDASSASSQIRYNYGRVKKLITEKYSNK